MRRAEIERGFIRTGWQMDDPYSRYPLVGNSGELSIVAYESYMKTDDPVFELVDRRQILSYWAWVIPTPRQVIVLLEEHMPEGKDEGEKAHNTERIEREQTAVGKTPKRIE